jgi:hypothetical protein
LPETSSWTGQYEIAIISKDIIKEVKEKPWNLGIPINYSLF